MNDPRQPQGSDHPWPSTGPSESPVENYPRYDDPAYAGQLPLYPSGYQPTEQFQRHWDAPPNTTPPGPGRPGEPPRFPSWLFLVAGAAVLLVVGMVIALMIANGTQRNSANTPTVTPLTSVPSTTTPQPAPTTTSPPTRTPTPSTTTPSTPAPTTSSSPGVPQTIVYSVTGTGKALSIAYIDTGGILQTEFNVTLPWSTQVTLTPPASTAATVTVVNFGAQISCSVSVDGVQVRQRTGSILTVCAAAG